MKKIITLFLIPMIALSIIGTSYALWSKTITLSGTVYTGKVDKEFTEIYCFEVSVPGGGEFEGKDVGKCTAWIDANDPEIAWFKIENGYPSYRVKVDWSQKNTGTIPIKVNDVILKVYDKNGNEIDTKTCTGLPCKIAGSTHPIELDYQNSFGLQLDPGASEDNALFVHVNQPAEQKSTYTVSLKERTVQWNEYPVPP